MSDDSYGKTADSLYLLGQPCRILLIPNCQDLLQHLKLYPHDKGGAFLFEPRHHARLELYFDDVVRFLHNMVAAVATTIDQTRINLSNANPDPNHPARLVLHEGAECFKNDGQFRFIRDLRNYMLHRAMPPLQVTWGSTKDEGESHAIALTTSEMLEWDGWKRPARTFLEDAGDAVELGPLVENYPIAAIQLDHDVRMAIILAHDGDLAEHPALAAEYDRLVNERMSLLSLEAE